MPNWPASFPILLAVGLAGAMLALVGMRVRQRWVLALGCVGLAAGYGPFLLVAWGLLKPLSVDRLILGRVPVPPNVASQSSVQTARIASDSLSREELAAIVRQGYPRGQGWTTGQRPEQLLTTEGISAHTRTTITEILIADAPKWIASGSSVDQVAPVVLRQTDLDAATRSTFIDMMIVMIRSGNESRRWVELVFNEVVKGALSERQRSEFLLAIKRTTFTPPDAVAPSATFEMAVQPRDQQQDLHVAGLGRLRITFESAPFALVDGPGRLHDDFGAARAARAVFRAPDEPGDYVIKARVTTEVPQNDLLRFYGFRSEGRPPGVRLSDLRSMSASTLVEIPVAVRGEQAAVAERVEDEEARAVVARAVKITKAHEEYDNGCVHERGREGDHEYTMSLRIERLPFVLSADVLIVDSLGEFRLGYLHVDAGKKESWSGHCSSDRLPEQDASVVLRPRPELARQKDGATRVYAGPEVKYDFELLMGF